MPKAKKASPRKLSKKANSPRATSPKTKAHRQEDAMLHQHFVNSLETICTYWRKQVLHLKKQLESLRVKSHKSSLKQKSAKKTRAAAAPKGKGQEKAKQAYQDASDQVAAVQAEMLHTRQALNQAKAAIDKYTQLSKLIDQFERDWLVQLGDDEEPAVTKKTTKTIKKTASATKPAVATGKKRGRKPKVKVDELVETAPFEEIQPTLFPGEASEEMMLENEEDFFSPHEETLFEETEEMATPEEAEFAQDEEDMEDYPS